MPPRASVFIPFVRRDAHQWDAPADRCRQGYRAQGPDEAILVLEIFNGELLAPSSRGRGPSNSSEESVANMAKDAVGGKRNATPRREHWGRAGATEEDSQAGS